MSYRMRISLDAYMESMDSMRRIRLDIPTTPSLLINCIRAALQSLSNLLTSKQGTRASLN